MAKDFQFSQDFDFRFLRNKTEYIDFFLVGTTPATVANYGVQRIIMADCVVADAWEVHHVAGTSGGAVTCHVEKLTSGTAIGSGNDITGNFDLKASVDTPRRGTLTSTLADKQLHRGDRLGLHLSGTPTSVDGVVVTLTLVYKK